MAVVTRPEPARAFAASQPAVVLPLARDLPRLRRKAGWGWIAAGAMLGAAVALLAGLRFDAGAAAPPPSAPEPAAATGWVEIEHPAPLYALSAPEFAKVPLLYRARLRVPGGGRQDVLSFGRFDGAYLHLSLYRPGLERLPMAPFFVAMARQAAEDALAMTRSDQPAPLATGFGAFELADVTLTQRTIEAACLGFRFDGEGPLQIAGLACGGPPEPEALACRLDGLRLVSGGADADLVGFFRAAEARSDRSCGRNAPKSTEPRKKSPN